MRTEEGSSTVLHRLIQEQLRYGNPTDTRTLLAIQQQALRRGAGSSQSSSESLTQDEPQSPKLSARQEPQGQEHQTDFQHSESYQLHPHLHEQLPTYEQAKLHSQYLAANWSQNGQLSKDYLIENSPNAMQLYEDERWNGKRDHVRSLSERLMHISLQRQTGDPAPASITSFSSYPQMEGYPHLTQGSKDKLHPWFEFTPNHSQEFEHVYPTAPPPFHSQHRLVPPVQMPEARLVFSSPPVGREVLTLDGDQMELLMRENERLRQELGVHVETSSRIQKLEKEVQRISQAYETLMQSCVKREALEQTLRNKLVSEVKRLQELNSELRDSLENTNAQAAKDVEAADHNQQMTNQLLVQIEEQKLESVRLESEVESQRLRAVMLERDLSSALALGRQLRAELQRKSAYVQRVERLQGALAQLQTTCEKREELELRLRTRLEQELKALRNQQRQSVSGDSVSSESVAALLERLREREERILALEADMTRWEQKYLEESTMREFAMDAAATAAAQRDTTIINHSPCHSTKNSFSEDPPHTKLLSQEMENRIRTLYGQILEKDAVINVLQQRLQQELEKVEVGGDMSLGSSAPSTDTSPTYNTGNSRTDVQSAGVSRLCRGAAAVCKNRSKLDAVTHTTASEQSSSTESSHESSQEQNPPPTLDPFKGLDSVEDDAEEIFI
ncbi:angiomotin-like protein 2b [Hoplias malabaricus]|uniref:angiomotin-like protein 2b n=1 Tax=Hoplias malabaricus TaxID=27720 RepID=UPI003462AD86